MKLIIQIPCFNEAQTLPLVFEGMPKRIPGIDEIEVLVIDDGSTDATEKVAHSLGVHHILKVSGTNRRWLGRAFQAGVDVALSLGADIVVNTDGDNQYPSEHIVDLVKPILTGEADIVIGDRKPEALKDFSPSKRFLQRVGNKFMEFVLAERIPDAVSGFRAYSRRALFELNVITRFTYTVDTLIQAKKKGLEVMWVEIEPNAPTRSSRLIKNNLEKVAKSGGNILRLVSIYEASRTLLLIAACFLVPALLLLGRFAYFFFYMHERAAGHVQSVIIGGACLVIAVTVAMFAILAGLLSVNRLLIEQLLQRVKRLEYGDEKNIFEEDRKRLSVLN